MDSLFGIEVLQRTRQDTGPREAMLAVVLTFDPALPDHDPSSRAAVRDLAASVGRALEADPTRMLEFRLQYCCKDPIWLQQVPYWPEVVQRVPSLARGQIASPIESEPQIVIPQRIDATTVPPDEYLFDLSMSGPLDITHLLSRMDPEAARAELDEFLHEAVAALHPEEWRRTRLMERHKRASARIAEEELPEVRQAELQALQAAVAELLGPEMHGRYARLFEERLERLLLGSEP